MGGLSAKPGRRVKVARQTGLAESRDELVHRGRLHLALDVSTWLARAETIPALVFVPVDTEIAVKSVELPGVFHKDPADRIIVATARKYAATIVTADAKIRAYPHVQTIW